MPPVHDDGTTSRERAALVEKFLERAEAHKDKHGFTEAFLVGYYERVLRSLAIEFPGVASELDRRMRD